MTKVNWDYENLRDVLKEKGYTFKWDIGSITFTSHVFEHKISKRRIEVWDAKNGELNIVDSNYKPVDVNAL